MASSTAGSIPWVWSAHAVPPAPLRIMDSLLPDCVTGQLRQILSLVLNGYGPIMCIFGMLTLLKAHNAKLLGIFEDYLTSTIHIKATDEAYDMVLAWISSHGLEDATRSIIARAGVKWKTQHCLGNGGKKPIYFSPWDGSFLFRFQGKAFFYKTKTISAGLHTEEVLSITCLGRSVQCLKDFIAVCRDEYLKQNENKMTVYKNSGDYWQKTMTKTKRPLSTVITGEAQKKVLVDDVKSFLEIETRAWYNKRSIPYRRGYLLYGPPGTGKSSLCLAVAGEFDLDIYVVNVPSVDDQTLEELFNSLPNRCVVLLEDIDAVGTDRSHDQNDPQKKMKKLSLSGLLNSLDGVASQEGRILFMTTNDIEKLDDALIRPGRIDRKCEVTLADSGVITQLFEFIFGPDKADIAWRNKETLAKSDEPSSQEGLPTEDIDVKKKGIESLTIAGLAKEFAAVVPEFALSPAEIMSYLLQHKISPRSAIDKAKEWVELMITEKATSAPLETNTAPGVVAKGPHKGGLCTECDKKGNETETRLKRTLKYRNLHPGKASPPPSLCNVGNPMKSNSPVSHDIMGAEVLSESSSIISSLSLHGSGSGTDATEGTVYDGDDEMNTRDISVDTGLSPISDEFRRLWNSAGNRKPTRFISHLPTDGINGRPEGSAHGGREGGQDVPNDTEPRPSKSMTSVVLDEGLWLNCNKGASIKEPHLKIRRCCKFHSAGEYATPFRADALTTPPLLSPCDGSIYLNTSFWTPSTEVFNDALIGEPPTRISAAPSRRDKTDSNGASCDADHDIDSQGASIDVSHAKKIPGEEDCGGMNVDDCLPPLDKTLYGSGIGEPSAENSAQCDNEHFSKAFFQVSGLSPTPLCQDAGRKPIQSRPLSAVGAPAVAEPQIGSNTNFCLELKGDAGTMAAVNTLTGPEHSQSAATNASSLQNVEPKHTNTLFGSSQLKPIQQGAQDGECHGIRFFSMDDLQWDSVDSRVSREWFSLNESDDPAETNSAKLNEFNGGDEHSWVEVNLPRTDEIATCAAGTTGPNVGDLKPKFDAARV